MTDILDAAGHCVLAFAERGEPVLVPMPFWSDGSALWLSLQSDSREVAALRRNATSAVYIARDEDTVATVVRGQPRVFGLHDPVGLALHGAVISAAMAALVARHAGEVAGFVQDASRVPARLLPRNRVAVRIPIDARQETPRPDPGPGVAPALATVIPASVRRAVAGRRQVALATIFSGRLDVGPAAWSAGYRMIAPPQRRLDIGAPAAVLVHSDPQNRPTATAGLVLTGVLQSGGTFKPERATSWSGFELRTVDVPAERRGIVLPD